MSLSLTQLIKEADRCVACGLCLPHCPTYRKTGSEADSPRGRIQLMRAVAQDVLPNNDRFKSHIDQCLSCRSCESVCPNNVNYGALVDSSRAFYIQKKNIWLAMTQPFTRYRYLQYGLSGFIWFTQKMHLDHFLNSLLPAAKLIPKLGKPVLWKNFYPANKIDAASSSSKRAVSLFLGCATNAFDTQTLKASIFVLNKLGVDVHIPSGQTCCGSVARQMGNAQQAQKLVTLNQDSFDKNWPVITIASGCGAGLKDYLPLHMVLDVSAFLITCDWKDIAITPLSTSIHVQDPCTLRNVQKSHLATYSLLKKIPQAQIAPLGGNAQCCGGAGAYMLSQKSMASELLSDKLEAIKMHKVTHVATSNIGCSLHIALGIREQNLKVTIEHPMQIMARQMGYSDLNNPL